MIAETGFKNSIESKSSFDEIYLQNSDMVLNLAYRMTGKEEMARDITQDVFMKVYQNLNTFHEQSKISTWIYKIAINHIINLLHREKRLRFFNALEKTFSADTNYTNAITVWEEGLPEKPDKVLEENEKEIIVRKFIDELAPKYKIPLLLFRYEEMSYKEISEQLKISLSAVESQIHRAKKKLAVKLRPWLNSL